MPELPEVETTVRGLRKVLEGERIERVEVRRGDLRRAFPPDLVQTLTGARVTALGRRAKYGLVHTDRGRTLVFHLGMSGRWRIDPDELGKHDHLLLETARHRLALNDARRFGSVDLVDEAELESWPAFKALGPEPLGEALTAEHLRAATNGRKPAIKLLLLDQRVIAGVGNIYACEALWRARIDPRKAGGKVTRPQLERLVPAIRAVLERSIAEGGSTLRNFVQPDGELGHYASRFDVYGREGAQCRHEDGGTIRRIVQGGRSTWFCPRCQK